MPRRVVRIWDLNRAMIGVLLKNTIETYPPEWRLIQEPLQNAMDSFLDEQGNRIATMDEEPTITLEIRVGSNLVVIRDNGKGIPPEKFSDFLLLGGGTKGAIVDSEVRKLFKGSQGVGVKSTVFTSASFEVSTVYRGQKWSMRLPSFSAYLDPGFAGEVEEPQPTSTGDHSGTELRIRLADYSTWQFIKDRVDEFFEALDFDASTANEHGRIPLSADRTIGPFDLTDILIRYFRMHSYVGDVSRTLGVDRLPDVTFVVEIICDFPADQESAYQLKGLQPLRAGSRSTGSSPCEYLNFAELIHQLPLRRRPDIVSDYKHILESGQHYSRPTVFYTVLTNDDFQQLLGTVRRRRPIDPHNEFPNILVHDANAIDRNRRALTKVNGGLMFVASRTFLRTVLAHKASASLSVNGIPTDLTIEITGAELGYLPGMHLVIDVDETLGYGKRNLAPTSKGAYNKFATDLWKTLHHLAGYIIGEEEERDLTVVGVRFNKPAEFRKIFDLGVDSNRRRAELLGRASLPESEEDVVATYFSMAARGLVPLYQFIRLSDITIYDGLALRTESIDAANEGDIIVVEFKPNTYELCKSDEARRQRFDEMQLAIVWEANDPADLPPNYTTLHREADIGYSGYLPGANHRVKRGRDSIQVIALKDIVEDALAGRATS